MKTTMQKMLTTIFIATSIQVAMAQETTTSTSAQTKSVSVTVYNQGFGVVREKRTLPLKQGMNILRYEDVAELIDPTSISFKSITAPDAVVVREQNYQYDLLNPTSILGKSVGKNIKFKQTLANGSSEIIEGTLLNAPYTVVGGESGASGTYAGMVIRTKEGKIILNPEGTAILDELPSGLVSKPSLVWRIQSNKAADHTTEASYISNGLNWKSDYVAIVSQDEKQIDLTGWVTLDNTSGATYTNAQLQLIAGDVRRVQEQPQVMYKAARMDMAMEAGAPQFKEESFFEYHLYTMDAPTTINNRETKQLQLLGANNVNVKRKLIFDGSKANSYYGGYNGYNGGGSSTDKIKAAIVVELRNNKENNMGMPLPKGKVRMYKQDSGGNLQFIGEDLIDHTPKDETLRLYVGDAFDVTGERRITETRSLGDRAQEQTFEIVIKNHKETSVEVNVVEHFWGDWEISKNNKPFNKLDATTAEFPLTIAKNSEAKVTFTVRTRW